MRKNVWKSLLLIAALCCSFAGAAACSTASGLPTVTLVEFVDETVQAGYGETYTLSLTAKDENGVYHPLSAKVWTKDWKEVQTLNGKFIVSDKGGYIIEYQPKGVSNPQKRTVTVQVVAKAEPVFFIDGEIDAVICGEDYQIPACRAEDYYDGALNAQVKVFKKAATQDVEVAYDSASGSYATTEAGEYYVQYTATNSNAVVGEKILPFYVREGAQSGEWDSFDDIGCMYTATTYDGVKKAYWYDEFEGREGVLRMRLNDGLQNWGTLWQVAPKSADITNYSAYPYVAVSAYIDGAAEDILNVRFMADCAIDTVKTGEWTTYYYDSAAWLQRWSIAVGATATKDGKEYLNATGAVFGDVSVYLDGIYFCNEIELACSFTEQDGAVVPSFTAEEGVALPTDFKVSYNGRAVEVKDGAFVADSVGEYKVTPMYQDAKAFTGQTFVYTSTGAGVLKLNDYTKEINSSTQAFVLPQATVVDASGEPLDGYTQNCLITYTNTLGESSTALAINPTKKGFYECRFTAKKDGAKKLEKTVLITVGDFLDGEILNVADDNAAKRMGASFTGGTFEKITLTNELNQKEGLPVSYVGVPLLKHAYTTTGAYTTNNSYFNFNSVKSASEIESCLENQVTLQFYLKTELADGVTEVPQITANVLGQSITLTPNATNTVKLSYAELLARYKKLSTHVTWADFAISVSTQIRQFKTFTFYFESITMQNVSDLPYAVRVTEDNKAQVYNPDIADSARYSFVDASSSELEDFAGEYTGSAVKIKAAVNEKYRIKNTYKPSQLNALKTEYNKVSVYVAVTGVKGVAYWMSPRDGYQSFQLSAMSSGKSMTEDSNKTWFKWTITLTQYIELLKANNYEYCNLFYCWYTQPKDLSAPLASGQANMTDAYFYIGNVVFEYEKPDVLIVDSQSFANIVNTDTGRAYASKADWENAGVSGEAVGYTGNATRFVGCSNQGFKIANVYTAEELELISQKYESVSMYFAIGGLENGEIYFNSTGFEGICQSGTTTYSKARGNINVWQKWTISIENYIQLVAANDYAYFKPWTDMSGYNVSGTFYYYFGNVIFE